MIWQIYTNGVIDLFSERSRPEYHPAAQSLPRLVMSLFRPTKDGAWAGGGISGGTDTKASVDISEYEVMVMVMVGVLDVSGLGTCATRFQT